MRHALAPSLVILLLAPRPANAAGREVAAALVEAAPLRGLVGQLGVRGEVMPWPRVALGASFARAESASERAAFNDSTQVIALEALFYPLGQKEWPVFFGAAFAQESALIGREAGRPSLTWARTHSDELYDRWVNHDTYLSFQQSVGYRVLSGSFFTASLRYTRDEVITTSSRDEADDVVSEQRLTTHGRVPVKQSLALYAGLYLP